MPITNQDGINRLMGTANSNAQSISDAMSRGVSNMSNSIGEVWGCPQATNFASEMVEKLTGICNNTRENMSAFQQNVASNVNNYNELNQSSSTTPAVAYSDPTLDTSGIRQQLASGDIGLVEGATTAVTTEYQKAIAEIESSINSAKSSIASSGAFDADEASAAAEMYNKAGTILADSNKELYESLNRYLQETIEQYGEVKRSNINRSNNA